MVRIVASVWLLGLFATNASAHAVGVDCTFRLGKIEVEVFYDDDTAASKAKVELVNAKDEVVESAISDKHGRCVLRKPAAGKYEVRVDAGAGHRARKKIEVPASSIHDAGIGMALDAALQAAPIVSVPSPIKPSISDSSVRAEFTRFPWEKLLIGIVVIGAVGGAFLLGSMICKNAKAKA
jgi:hypothetical protein